MPEGVGDCTDANPRMNKNSIKNFAGMAIG